METKTETPAALSREELKALMREAFADALRDFKAELKPLVKDALRERLQEQNGATETEHDRKVKAILEEHLVRYRKVWEALA